MRNKMRLGCLCGVLAASTVAAAAAPGPRASIQKAEALVASGRYAEARSLAVDALRGAARPREAPVWKWLIAESYQLEGDYEEAVRAFGVIRREEPGRVAVEATLRQAKCCLQMWDTRRAIQALESLRDSDLGERKWERDELEAIALFAGGKPNASLKALEKLPRKSGAGWHYLGLIAFNSGEFEKAARCFDRALQQDPGDYYNLLFRASSLLELNRIDEARSGFRKILEFAPTPEVYEFLGRLELRAEHFVPAEAYLRKSVELSPQDPEAYFHLMKVLRRLGKKEEAAKVAITFRKLHLKQQEGLAVAYRLDQAHQANPKDPGPPEKLAEHYLAAHDPAAAERMAWRALTLDPKRLKARLCLARTSAMVGRFGEAALHYRKALRYHPNSQEALRELRELVRLHARRTDGEKD